MVIYILSIRINFLLNFTDVLKVDLKDEIPDASSLKTLSIPQDTLFDEDLLPDPSFMLGKLICSESNIFLKNPNLSTTTN